MQEQFITYEVAVKLKELGFKEECFAEYSDKGTLLMNYPHECFYGYCDINEYEGLKETKNVLAPLWQQAFDWCLKKIKDNDNLNCWLIQKHEYFEIVLDLSCTYEESLGYGTREDCLTKLIELCK